MEDMSKTELFLELAKADENGISRWVNVSEFTGKYARLQFGNGGYFIRRSSNLAKKYIIEKDKISNRINAIRLNGFNNEDTFNQYIRRDIKDFYKDKNCVMLGINGETENVEIQIDHKDGRKNDLRISNAEQQKRDDFQSLCRAANDIKREICKQCAQTNKRWDARNIKGNPYSYYEGGEEYTNELKCKGCYQYNPVEYRKTSARKISGEVCADIIKKLYPEGDQ